MEVSDKELLIRIDERTKNIVSALSDFKLVTNREIADIKTDMVTQSEFKPVRSIAFGLIAIICTAVLGAIIGLVVMK